MRLRCLLFISLASIAVAAPAASADTKAPPGAFVSLKDVVPGIRLDIRYRTSHNFVGRPIKGYEEADCIVTRQTADALAKVQAAVSAEGYTLKFYDCYRPKRAVADFVAWGKRVKDQRMKREFYPSEPKSRVFKDGYIATKSGHSRGSTVDLSVVKLPGRSEGTYKRGQKLVRCTAPFSKRFRDSSIDMGSGYDCFDSISHPFSKKVGKRQHANRMFLRRAMLAQGFEPLPTEWWHFTLKKEPYPSRAFDFPVSRSSLR